jgi:CDP-glycerol glycerophosphotransferase (TagB/SpsB family)
MKSFTFKIIFLIFNTINYLTPKRKKRTVFCGTPDFDDMLRGLIPYIEDEEVYVLTKSSLAPPAWIPKQIKVVKKNSFRGLYMLLTSSKIYFTHGIYSFFDLLPKERQHVINLWHGMPIKNIGFLDGKTSMPQFHTGIATSKMFRTIMAKAFNVEESKFIVSGLPRNELLTKPKTNQFIIKELEVYSKVYVWLPTYRKSNIGDIREDSSSTSVVGVDGFDFNTLDRALVKINAVIYIKPHPMAIYNNETCDYQNIKFIDEGWLLSHQSSLYEFLSFSDILISDYSSVVIDYQCTGLPVILYSEDMVLYKNNRGFTIDLALLNSMYNANNYTGHVNY